LEELAELGATDSATAGLLEGFTELASEVAQCPIAWVSFMAAEHEVGAIVWGGRARVIPREESQGQELIETGIPIAVQTPTRALPVESDRRIAYYAGFPLITSTGFVIGGIAVADSVTRTLSIAQQAALSALARRVVQTLETNRALREAKAELAERKAELETYAQAVGKLQDVTIAKDVRAAELVERNAELQSMAETDGLTGLRNYRSLNQHIRAAFAADAPVALLLIDIDWFKNFNDAYGHVAGDDTLKTVGSLIAMEATGGIIAARYGGEEFALVVPSADPKVVLEVGEHLRQRIERHPWQSRPITICVGCAVRTSDIQVVEDLIRRADDALYAAKRTGKNRVLLWSPR
jgi:diguanylate cyclase (GGDEF)-like protein